MKAIIVKSILVTFTLAVGIAIGWWVNSPGFDLLCSSSAVYALGKDIEGEGIFIKSGTEVNLRSCEYANRFSVQLFYEKGNYPDLFILKKSKKNISIQGADQYSVSVAK